MLRVLTALTLFLFASDFLTAQSTILWSESDASEIISDISIPYTKEIQQRRTAEIEICLTENQDTPWPAKAVEAVTRVVEVWLNEIEISVPLHIDFRYESMGNLDVLTRQGAFMMKTKEDAISMRQETYYPVSLANQLEGKDFSGTGYDLTIIINSDLGDAGLWYFGLDAETPTDQYDLVSALMKSMAQGLGLSSSVFMSGTPDRIKYGIGSGSRARPAIYDHYIQNYNGDRLTDFDIMTFSEGLSEFVRSDEILWNGAKASGAKLHAPRHFEQERDRSVSISSLDELVYNDTEDAFMTAHLRLGEAVHAFGDVTKDMLRDIGWRFYGDIGLQDEISNDDNALRPQDDHEIGLQVFPNPTHERVNIDWNDKHAVSEVQLIDMSTGRLILTQMLDAQADRTQLDLQGISAGKYAVRLISSDAALPQQILIKE